MKILSALILGLLCSTSFVNAKDSITVLNTGSKSGSFAMMTTAISEDLSNAYSVDYKSPGDYCVAIDMAGKINGSVIMPWAADIESVGRDGKGCVTWDVDPATIIAYHQDNATICTMNKSIKDFFVDSNRVGHSVPQSGFARAIDNINNSLGTNLTSVPYDGSGDARKALYAGEVDFTLLSPKHARKIEKEGGKCFFEMSDSSEKYIPLQSLDPDNKFLSMGYATIWLGINLDGGQISEIKNQLENAYRTPGTAFNTYTGNGSTVNINWNLSNDQIIDAWEQRVAGLRD